MEITLFIKEEVFNTASSFKGNVLLRSNVYDRYKKPFKENY